MKSKTLLFLLAGAAVLTACTLKPTTNTTGSDETNENMVTNPEEGPDDTNNKDSQNQPAMEVTVTVTSEGFSPATVTIKKGGTVTWVNMLDEQVWVASALHPTHKEYPGFDQLKGMGKGGSYSFTFDKVGSWKYHDHLNPSRFGKVEVVE